MGGRREEPVDVRVIGAETYSIALLAGDDVFTARGGAVNSTALATGVSTLTAMAQGIQVLGGDGADTLTGGDGNVEFLIHLVHEDRA